MQLFRNCSKLALPSLCKSTILLLRALSIGQSNAVKQILFTVTDKLPPVVNHDHYQELNRPWSCQVKRHCSTIYEKTVHAYF